MQVLTDQECWELLAGEQIGRLAVVVADRPDIFPVNFVVHDGRILFRTAEGSKLASVVIHREIAFEVDGFDEATNEAWSVVLDGMARVLEHDDEVEAAESLPLFPWNISPKNHFVEIEALSLSGRRFVAEGRH